MKLLVLLLCLIFPGLAYSQSINATISGGVTDPAGNLIIGADVLIKNDATGLVYAAKTNRVGMYLVPVLPPGRYHVQVSKEGFKSVIKAEVVLNVESAVALNFELQVGAASESVTVDSATPAMNTTDASVSTVIDKKFIENVPLNGRSFQDLISMTPGVVTVSPQAQPGTGVQRTGDFSVNGQRSESNYYTVDGVSANIGAGNTAGSFSNGTSGSLPGSTALGTTQSIIPLDALQEFRVLSSTYSAEFGRSPGGQFTFATRSGANQFHGSAYDYLRNNFFDANDWFNDHNHVAIAALRQNDFGGTLGGRLFVPHLYQGRDRSFFFVAYEGLRLTQPQAATVQYVPDTFMRTQAAAQMQPILNAFPLPTAGAIDYGSASAPSLAQFIGTYAVPSRIDSTSVRLDHTFNKHLSAFFRFGNTPSSTKSRVLSALTTTSINTRTYTFGLTTQWNSAMTNDLRVGYAQSDSFSTEQLDGFGGATAINLGSQMAQGTYPSIEPILFISISGIGTSTLAAYDRAANQSRQWNIVDTFSVVHGRHFLRFGVDYRRIESPTSPVSPAIQAEYLSTKGLINNSSELTFLIKRNSSVLLFHEMAAFAEDEWRLSPKFSLSAGLRWEVDPPPTSTDGNPLYTVLGNVSQPSTLSLAPAGTSLWKTSWYNFAPRLGFAWTPRGSEGKDVTVVRAGGGVFFDTDDQIAAMGVTGLGFLAQSTLSSVALPITSAQLAFPISTAAPYTSASLYAYPQHLQLPYTLQWNASIQQALGKQQSFTLTYVGANGRRLLQSKLLSVKALNPLFSSIYYTPSGITSNYHSLQAQFQRTVARGLHALVSYTWSHSIDYGSNSTTYPAVRGNSDFDVRNNFVAGLSWDIPPVGSELARVLSGGWGVDGRFMSRTAFPITLNGSTQTDSVGGVYYTGVNYDPSKPLYLYSSSYAGGKTLNAAAFSLPTGTSMGNAPRNFVRGFGMEQVNLAIRRDFPLVGDLHLQFRAETFNLLNHPNFGYVVPTLSNAQFGQATKMLNQSLGTLSSQYQSGGPRSMQFALRLTF
ncbi:MAG: carboxypeptidase regulatory-like domain-containing protein [Acidobacteriaceae bacterium]|nr:carboxypeptidase regulatory-like domain-containing protein [Acidobacteriaceae bacterium]